MGRFDYYQKEESRKRSAVQQVKSASSGAPTAELALMPVVRKSLEAMRGVPSKPYGDIERLMQLIEQASTDEEFGVIESFIHGAVIDRVALRVEREILNEATVNNHFTRAAAG